jgi:hypothetical protein
MIPLPRAGNLIPSGHVAVGRAAVPGVLPALLQTALVALGAVLDVGPSVAPVHAELRHAGNLCAAAALGGVNVVAVAVVDEVGRATAVAAPDAADGGDAEEVVLCRDVGGERGDAEGQ